MESSSNAQVVTQGSYISKYICVPQPSDSYQML